MTGVGNGMSAARLTPSVGYVINTYRSLEDVSSAAGDWMLSSRQLLAPAVEDLQRLEAPEGESISDFGPAGSNYEDLSVETLAGAINALDPADGWSKLHSMFSAGRIQGASYSAAIVKAGGAALTPDFEVHLDVTLEGYEWPAQAHSFGFAISRPLFDRVSDRNAGFIDEVVHSAQELAQAVGAVTGFITADLTHYPESPYEVSLQEQLLLSTGEGRTYCRRWLRGAYWGNFLSSEHLRNVGGIDTLRVGLPQGAQLVELDPSADGLVYVQFPGDLRSPDQLPSNGRHSVLGPAVLPEDRVARNARSGPD